MYSLLFHFILLKGSTNSSRGGHDNWVLEDRLWADILDDFPNRRPSLRDNTGTYKDKQVSLLIALCIGLKKFSDEWDVSKDRNLIINGFDLLAS